MKPDADKNDRFLSRVAFGYATTLFTVIVLIVAGSCPVQAQEPWGMRTSTPRSVASGPLWVTPNVVQDLRSDRYYSLVVTGAVKLGEEHYGNYYKGYYGDAGYRWESTSMDQNYPTLPPQRSGVVATNLTVGLAEQSYRQNHIYTTGWFIPTSSTMTIQLAVRPSRDNNGQIIFHLVELHPDANPRDYTFNAASATWQYNGDFMGQPNRGVDQDSIWDVFAGPTPQNPWDNGNTGLSADPNRGNVPVSNNPWGNGNNVSWTPGTNPGGLGNNGLFGNSTLPPLFNESSGVCVDTHSSMFPEGSSGFGPADVNVGPGFGSAVRPGSSAGTNRGNAINLLDQIASPVRY